MDVWGCELRLFYLLLLIPIFHSMRISTAGELFTKAESCVCGKQAQPFEEPIRFGFGPYRGQCVSSCKFRRAVELDSAQAQSTAATAITSSSQISCTTVATGSRAFQFTA